MVSRLELKRNIERDQSRTKYILYLNRLSNKEFFVPIKSESDRNREMELLGTKPWCTRVRVSIKKPKRANRR